MILAITIKTGFFIMWLVISLIAGAVLALVAAAGIAAATEES